MTEVTLPGGNTVGAVRIGDVVHKQASPTTATVHALLRYLENAGVDGVPRALGFDEQGRQMLTYLPGETIGGREPGPAWVHADALLPQVGRWLRRVHDVTARFVPPADERWFTGETMRPGWIIGHQDVAPHNAAIDGDRLVGFFDWDTASPSSPEVDLAFAALSWVPLWAARPDQQSGTHGFDNLSRRLHILLDSYGYTGDRHAFGDVVARRARRQASVIRQLAESGDQAMVAILHLARNLDTAADNVEKLPAGFWTP
ncbi:aminoglycoside phosphotransferase/kinase family protein [Flindersiella endophytica]